MRYLRTFGIFFIFLLTASLPVLADVSVEEMTAKAESGDAKAQCSLGVWYHFGLFVTKDFEQAMKWYRRASEQGNANAQFGLGVLYARGQGVDKDEVEACKWFVLSAIQGNKEAVPERERLTNQLSPAQFREAKKRAIAFIVHKENNRKPEAETAITKPTRKEDEDEDEERPAVKPPETKRQPPRETVKETPRQQAIPSVPLPPELATLQTRAEQGDIEAQKSLGQHFETGKDVPQNYTLAALWYRRAADQGDTWAQISLGTLYVNGQGVARDNVEAFKWIAIAVQNGGTWFGSNGKDFVRDMTPDQINEAKSRAIEFRPQKESPK